MAAPTSINSCCFSLLKAGAEDEKGKLIPIASIADDNVFAVYIPPQAPAPGQEFLMIPLYSSSFILPSFFSPNASKAEMIFNFLPQ